MVNKYRLIKVMMRGKKKKKKAKFGDNMLSLKDCRYSFKMNRNENIRMHDACCFMGLYGIIVYSQGRGETYIYLVVSIMLFAAFWFIFSSYEMFLFPISAS